MCPLEISFSSICHWNAVHACKQKYPDICVNVISAQISPLLTFYMEIYTRINLTGLPNTLHIQRILFVCIENNKLEKIIYVFYEAE
jgi:hypothetical protein